MADAIRGGHTVYQRSRRSRRTTAVLIVTDQEAIMQRRHRRGRQKRRAARQGETSRACAGHRGTMSGSCGAGKRGADQRDTACRAANTHGARLQMSRESWRPSDLAAPRREPQAGLRPGRDSVRGRSLSARRPIADRCDARPYRVWDSYVNGRSTAISAGIHPITLAITLFIMSYDRSTSIS